MLSWPDVRLYIFKIAIIQPARFSLVFGDIDCIIQSVYEHFLSIVEINKTKEFFQYFDSWWLLVYREYILLTVRCLISMSFPMGDGGAINRKSKATWTKADVRYHL